MSKKNLVIALFCSATLLAAGRADAAEPSVRIEGAAQAFTTEVVAVDLPARVVTLKGLDGNDITVKAGPEVRNLDQIDVGDAVDVEYSEILVTELHKSKTGVKKRIESLEVERAPLGAKPAGIFTRTVEFGAAVMGLDKASRVVRLQGARGAVAVKVSSDIDLDKVAVGDHVEGSYVEQLRISVSPGQ